MIEINKLEKGFELTQNGDKTNEPAIFDVNSRDNIVALTSNSPNYKKTIVGIYDQFVIDGTAPTSAADAVLKLRAFVNFKASAGGSGTGTTNHASLTNLTFANSGHVGFEQKIITPDIIYLNDGSPNGGDGTIARPFNNIQIAQDAATFGSNIKCAPGMYGALSIDRQNCSIIAQGTTGQYRMVLDGGLTITAAAARIGLENIQVNGDFVSNGSLVYPDNIAVRGKTTISSGYHRFDNCFFMELEVLGDAIVELINCRSENISSWKVLSAQATLIINGYDNVKLVRTAGIMVVRGPGSFLPVGGDNIAIEDTANDGLLWVDGANFMSGAIQANLVPADLNNNAGALQSTIFVPTLDAFGVPTYFIVKKTGTSPCIWGMNMYNPAISTLNGVIAKGGLQWDQVFNAPNLAIIDENTEDFTFNREEEQDPVYMADKPNIMTKSGGIFTGAIVAPSVAISGGIGNKLLLDNGTSIDYKPRTLFNPSAEGFTHGSGVANYTARNGWYLRIGGKVLITVQIAGTFTTKPDGNLYITIPFLVASISNGTAIVYGKQIGYVARPSILTNRLYLCDINDSANILQTESNFNIELTIDIYV